MAIKNLRRLKVANFYSFDEEGQEIFFTVNGDVVRENPNTAFISVSDDHEEFITPVTLIYGANASGKTNLLQFVGVLNEILKRVNQTASDKLPYIPFDKSNKPSCIEIEFIIKDVIYSYQLEYTQKDIVLESLFVVNKSGVMAKLYERQNSKVVFGRLSKVPDVIKKEIKDRLKTRNDISVLEILNVGNIKPYVFVYDFLRSPATRNVGKLLYDNSELRKTVLMFLKKADVGIVDLQVEREGYKDSINPDIKNRLLNDGIDIDKLINVNDIEYRYKIYFKHKGIGKRLSINEESAGTGVFLKFLTRILPICLHDGGVYVVDELEENLHPLLAKQVIEMFNNKLINKSGAQLVAVTHETLLMDTEGVVSDDIWFVEKNNKTGVSVVYPLSQFTDIESAYDFQKAYLKGRFGGIPYLGSVESLAKLIESK
ncbi:MAG: ATP-binding protein [Muribaculaceae bacterium]|nr:ATP-binding protein [Muribaculaceae bacterium]